MSDAPSWIKTRFPFGTTTVQILEGDILSPGVAVDAVVSTDDNYLTMASGVAALLRREAGPKYVLEAQAKCPVRAGTVVVTAAHALTTRLPATKRVLHGTVIDYDSADWSLERLVCQTTVNCLQQAEDLGLRSILFPALATGAGGLPMQSCARQMCSAIKDYLAQERPLKEIDVILYQTPQETTEAAKYQSRKERNQRFVKEANLILDTPYNPALSIGQTRDFFGYSEELRQLEGIVTGREDDERGKWHVVILGSPYIGKSALLDQLWCRAQQPDSPLSQGRRCVRITFGNVHEDTPPSFIYQKLLCAMGQREDDQHLRQEIRELYADRELDCDRFLAFLTQHEDRYPEVVFLVDRLPQLLQMEAQDSDTPDDVRAFWRDLDRLQERLRFVYTATDDAEYEKLRQERLEHYTDAFHQRTKEIRLACLSDQQRAAWVTELYQRYLGRSPTPAEQEFFEREAGCHPYLLSLAGCALVEAVKQYLLDNPTAQFDTPGALEPFFQAARHATEGPRQDFFEELMRACRDRDDLFELSTLAKAVALESEREALLPDAGAGNPKAIQRLSELLAMGDPRQALHSDRLQRLEAQGYLVDAAEPGTARFMADSFAAWVAEYFGVGMRKGESVVPQDAVITLHGPQQEPGSDRVLIETSFRSRGPRIVTAKTPLQHKEVFMENFDRLVRNVLHPTLYPDRGEFSNLEEVGGHVLDCFTTGRIRSYLKHLPYGSTISLEVADGLKDLPWELMLEAVYAGEIPVRVGRRILGQEQPSGMKPPVRGNGKVRALLIGDPTDDLAEARAEVQNLAQLMRDDGRFTLDDDDILIGSSACRLLRLLKQLRSGKYGLIHYSGHSVLEGDQSAWLLKDARLDTFDLTSSLRDAPPALVFSSSCESAGAGEPRAIKYEDQAFDLPSAFLNAGVEAYVGTLWEVESTAARQFAAAFYRALLTEGHCLGEALRLAKMASKPVRDRINWLAFILYGDPHLEPGELFPALKRAPAFRLQTASLRNWVRRLRR